MVPRAAWCKTGWNNLVSSPWREGELWLGTGLQVIPCEEEIRRASSESLETTLVLAGRSPEVGALVGGGAIVVRLREETAAGIFLPEFADGIFLPGDGGANPWALYCSPKSGAPNGGWLVARLVDRGAADLSSEFRVSAGWDFCGGMGPVFDGVRPAVGWGLVGGKWPTIMESISGGLDGGFSMEKGLHVIW
ncbi:Uncharacterized protein Adt_28712 [Abeliophyllum distichum]|uniref:Uncharacterized protein n=1 Tax=Abeliophyllum distichum TaxID=126358 RepID=A0ABD1RXB7_9LAMI